MLAHYRRCSRPRANATPTNHPLGHPSLSIQCRDHSLDDSLLPEYRSILVYASLMVVIIPIGVPAILFTLLWLERDEIEQRETRRGGPELKYLSFLFRLYGREHCELGIPTAHRPHSPRTANCQRPTAKPLTKTLTYPIIQHSTIHRPVRLRRVLFDHRLLPAHHPLECGARATNCRDGLHPRVHRQCVLRAHVP